MGIERAEHGIEMGLLFHVQAPHFLHMGLGESILGAS